VLLGIAFLGFQAEEYIHAYKELGLTLGSGVYGATFFMLTGFHGAHVTIGTLILLVMLMRIVRGHFNAEHQFGFQAASWYWHFVDVVWVGAVPVCLRAVDAATMAAFAPGRVPTVVYWRYCRCWCFWGFGNWGVPSKNVPCSTAMPYTGPPRPSMWVN
jgi:hypothetical protein